MINTNYSNSSTMGVRSGRSGGGQSLAGDSFTASTDSGTRGLFFGKPVAEEPKAQPEIKRASAQKLQQGLGLSQEQAKRLSDAANEQPYFEPWRAGKVDTGEVFLVTQQNYSADPAGFQGYENYFKVYVMAGDEMKELSVSSARRMRDGGSTTINTDAATFDFPIRGESTVGGRALVSRLDSMQLI
ncbi:hypothetical protein IV102_33730 [bacterium]|nr:hypothetical protein [bacterium]